AVGDAGIVARLYLAGIVSSNALATASFTDGAGWSLVAVDGAHPVADVAITAGPSSLPVIVARETDSGGTLGYAVQQPCSGLYAPLAPLYTGAATSNRPSLAGGATVDVIYRG